MIRRRPLSPEELFLRHAVYFAMYVNGILFPCLSAGLNPFNRNYGPYSCLIFLLMPLVLISISAGPMVQMVIQWKKEKELLHEREKVSFGIRLFPRSPWLLSLLFFVIFGIGLTVAILVMRDPYFLCVPPDVFLMYQSFICAAYGGLLSWATVRRTLG